MKKDTSWDNAAGWYHELLESEGTYQKDLILPNILRLLQIKPGEKILDLACGQGFFSRAFKEQGAEVTGIDSSAKLIGIAKEKSRDIKYFVLKANELAAINSASIDKAVIILALQNIENLKTVFMECARVLKSKGRLYAVINHPAFRIPKASSWEYDEERGIQYRRVEKYLSESKAKIFTHPGSNPKEYTLTFHRPLQTYVKNLANSGFCIRRLEEWNSLKKSRPGNRAAAENLARKEVPFFLAIEAEKLN